MIIIIIIIIIFYIASIPRVQQRFTIPIKSYIVIKYNHISLLAFNAI
jgi:hypothetical protein